MLLYPNPTITMKYNKIFIAVCLLLSLPIVAVAQEEETDDLGTQEVTVVRSYNPSLKSVFKIRTNPEIDDSLVQKKIKVDYTFEPIPVVSTFIPNKASPLKLQRRESSFLITVEEGFIDGSQFVMEKFQANRLHPVQRHHG